MKRRRAIVRVRCVSTSLRSASAPTGPRSRRRSRPSPTTPSCPTARSPRSSRPAAASSGCACRAWTGPASSVRSSTETPATFGSVRRTIAVPVDRRYLPGTLVLETSWGTSTGWVIVRDALLMGPWHEDLQPRNDYSRAPTDYAAEGILIRTVRCVNGEVQVTLDCEPVFDYGRRRGVWAHGDRPYHSATCRDPESDLSLRLTTDLRVGFEGPKAVARSLMKEGDYRFVALSWGAIPRARDLRGRLQAARLDGAPLAALARPRPLPRSPVARVSPAQRAHAPWPDLRAHGRPHRRAHHVPPRDPRRRAQLGLSLHVDPRFDVHPVGARHARVRLGGRRLLLVHRGRRRRLERPAGHVRHRWRADADRGDPRPPPRV